MSKGIKVIIGMIITIIILFVLNKIIDNNSVKILNTDPYITINKEKMPSIYEKIGEKTITNITDGFDGTGKYIEITYNNITVNELSSYIIELGNQNYALTSSDDDSAVLAKESNKNNTLLTISISISNGKTTIKYARGSGTLTRGDN